MALTARAWQERIVVELSEKATTGDLLRGWIESGWEGNSAYAASPRLRYLTTKRDAIDFLIGRLDDEPTAPAESPGYQQTINPRRTSLLALRSELADLINRANRGRPCKVAAQIQVSPLDPPEVVDVGNASDPIYQGTPYVRPLRVQAP